MKLIAGLGNPGRRYKNTRHNIGFRVIDKLANKYNAKLKRQFFQRAKAANLSILGENILVIQPLTFINLSGGCIRHFYKSLKLNLKDLLVICDDINLPLGKIRIRPSGSAGGHNGLTSIIDSLGTEEFPRLRIGVGRAQPIEDFVEYVLLNFAEEEEKTVEQATEEAASACESWIKDGTEVAMNRYN